MYKHVYKNVNVCEDRADIRSTEWERGCGELTSISFLLSPICRFVYVKQNLQRPSDSSEIEQCAERKCIAMENDTNSRTCTKVATSDLHVEFPRISVCGS